METSEKEWNKKECMVGRKKGAAVKNLPYNKKV